MNKLNLVNKTRLKLEEDLSTLYDNETEILKEQIFKCSSCKKGTKLNSIEKVYWMKYYVEPYGCSCGDYWLCSNEIVIACPKCDKLERFYENKLFHETNILKDLHSKFGLFVRVFGDIYREASREYPDHKLKIWEKKK